MKLVRNIILYKCTFHAMCSHQGQNWTFSLSLSLETGRVQSVTKSDQNWKKMTEEWKCKNPVKDFKARQQLLQTNFIFSLGRTEQEATVNRPGRPAVVCPWSQSVKVKAAVKLFPLDAASSSRLPAYIQDFIYWDSRPSQTLPHSYLEIFSWQSF